MKDTSQHMMYHCLLILTDGIIHDLRETVDRIVRGASYPLSIIIVGIGDADFTAMETLDSDEYDLVDGHGEAARRDICQFVKLNEFKEGDYTHVDKLAEAVLGEVPDQLVGYMTERGLKPGMKPYQVNQGDEELNDDDDSDKSKN